PRSAPSKTRRVIWAIEKPDERRTSRQGLGVERRLSLAYIILLPPWSSNFRLLRLPHAWCLYRNLAGVIASRFFVIHPMEQELGCNYVELPH
ncbi:MAG: hypothetical protein VX936_04100, partial [Planctomycetota bacterium]|nr:hypothetical protein [Planctomycetota bacterium]